MEYRELAVEWRELAVEQRELAVECRKVAVAGQVRTPGHLRAPGHLRTPGHLRIAGHLRTPGHLLQHERPRSSPLAEWCTRAGSPPALPALPRDDAWAHAQTDKRGKRESCPPLSL
eukprot:gene11642-biopygen344